MFLNQKTNIHVIFGNLLWVASGSLSLVKNPVFKNRKFALMKKYQKSRIKIVCSKTVGKRALLRKMLVPDDQTYVAVNSNGIPGKNIVSVSILHCTN
jgi:hypothetical protein